MNKEIENINPQVETIRFSSLNDVSLFERLVHEAQLEKQIKIWWFPEDPEDIDSQIYGRVRAWEPRYYERYLEAVRTFIRKKALFQNGCENIWPGKTGRQTLFSFDHIITYRDIEDNPIFEGKIEECQLPTELLLSQAGMGNDWHEVYFWNLGNVKDLKSHQTSTGCLLLKKPGVFLFTDELSKLATGEFVTLQKHQPWVGFISMTFEGCQIINGEIIRIWADYTD